MKKYKFRMLSLLTSVMLCMGNLSSVPAYAATTQEGMRAVWISTVYSADFPSTQNDPDAQKIEFVEKLDKAKALGLNTVVVQIRPKADAFYDSDLNPWSSVLTGIQGRNPGYDPMAFMIEEAHKRGMEFHAWMNPYRITTSGVDLGELSADNMARKHPDWILTYNNAMYFDPAKEEVKQYIVDTVAEVVTNYDVDAIHFDDYFYPSNYPLPEGEGKEGTVANERRMHVNDLIQRVDQTIHSIDASVAFGISPMGVWKNSSSDPEGSATKGSEGYYTVYGDAKKWVEEGWVDYIVPQIYWETGNSSADYETLVKWWNDVVEGTDVALYIGQGVYKDLVASEITKQLEINQKYDNVSGSFYFSLRDLLNDRQGAGTAIQAYYAKQDAAANTNHTENATNQKTAYAGRAQLRIDGKDVAMDIYIIDDYSYFKLRDLAYAMTGTSKQFDTIWIEADQAIHLQTGIPYTLTGSGTEGKPSQGEPSQGEPSQLKDAVAVPSSAHLFVDGNPENVSAYTIQDYTYYKLRDLSSLVGFEIAWDEQNATIDIDTSA